MLELILDFLIFIFGDKAFKKLKQRIKNIKLKRSDPSSSPKVDQTMSDGTGGLLCAGCGRPLKKPPVYEQGKAWCFDCYKTSVLKIPKK
jgi:hypothetical protein